MSDTLSYIDRYFKDELSSHEKKAFEGRCLSDPALARIVALYITLHEHLQEQWIEQKGQEFDHLEISDVPADAEYSMNDEPGINSLNQENETAPPLPGIKRQAEPENSMPFREIAIPVNSSKRKEFGRNNNSVSAVQISRRLAIAAALLGVISLGITMYVQNRKAHSIVAVNGDKPAHTNSSVTTDTSSSQTDIVSDRINKQAINNNDSIGNGHNQVDRQQLFARNFTPDAPPKEPDELLEEAFTYYEKGSYGAANKEYEKALALMENLETRMTEDEQTEKEKKRLLFYAHYYNGLSYMAAGKTAKAIGELKAIKEPLNGYWQAKRQWYLALAYLKSGETGKALASLKGVAASKQAAAYRQKAIALINELQDASIN